MPPAGRGKDGFLRKREKIFCESPKKRKSQLQKKPPETRGVFLSGGKIIFPKGKS